MRHRPLLTLLLITALLGVAVGCARRMAPFAPHRTNTDFHRAVLNSRNCIECHALNTLSSDHGAADDCLKCHRILQGE
jgi:hypothetical protein